MIELGLQRISRLLAQTPLPWRAIHVAGTNGKGSICAYVSGMLDVYNKSSYRAKSGKSALKHARFTSPHLIDRWDGITIDQQTVPLSVFDQVEQKILGRNEAQVINASEFEILTATAFEIFTQEQVDVGVVEVGMGGRLDATNIIGQPVDPQVSGFVDVNAFRPSPLITAISKIGLDHQAYLGNTISAIAKEKAGIAKQGVPIVYDPSNVPEVTAVLRGIGEYGRAVHFRDDLIPMPPMPAHMKYNAGVAWMSTWLALERLERLPNQSARMDKDDFEMLAVLAEDMLQVPLNTVFPGRLQRFSIEALTGRKEPILLDGAHNAQSAEVLKAELASYAGSPDADVTWVIATSDSKPASEILEPLLQDGDSLFAVEFGPVDGMPWVKPTPSSQIINAAQGIITSDQHRVSHNYGRDVLTALRAASDEAVGRPLVIAGSLYLVGDVLRLLRDAKSQTDRH